MSEFTHSMVLFTGDDGLPLEFNVRNTAEKLKLRELIEYGGGLCSKSENAVHLINPGTRVLNAASGKRLVSTRYIFDCIEENYLLDVDSYIVTVEEASQPNMSDDEHCAEENTNKKLRSINYSSLRHPNTGANDSVHTSQKSDEITSFTSPKKSLVNTKMRLNTFEGFDSSGPEIVSVESEAHCEKEKFAQKPFISPSQSDGTNKNTIDESSKPQKNVKTSSNSNFIAETIEFDLESKAQGDCSVPWASTAKVLEDKQSMSDFESNNISQYPSPQFILDKNESNIGLASNSQKNGPYLNIEMHESINIEDEEMAGRANSPSNVQVTSSQSKENTGELDEFDKLLLFLGQTNQRKEKEKLSESFHVSSSADAQVSKPNSEEVLPDNAVSSSQEEKVFDPQAYMKNLEEQVAEVLKKMSPLTISEKSTLVKYICIVDRCSVSDAIKRINGF